MRKKLFSEEDELKYIERWRSGVYKSVRSFSKAIGVHPSTLTAAFKRHGVSTSDNRNFGVTKRKEPTRKSMEELAVEMYLAKKPIKDILKETRVPESCFYELLRTKVAPTLGEWGFLLRKKTPYGNVEHTYIDSDIDYL